MIRDIGVAAVPGSSFFREPVNNYIRLHFAREKSTLAEVIRRLCIMGGAVTMNSVLLRPVVNGGLERRSAQAR